MPKDDVGWRLQALCGQVDPELWFQEPGTAGYSAELERAAKAICRRCPVRAKCLDDAIDTGEMTFGIRGGLSPGERRAWLAAHWLERAS